MLSIFLVCLGLVADDGTKPSDRDSADRAAYQAAAARVAGDAGAQVRLALWCERHGLNAERMKHLAAAVAQDPSHALARGLLGLVSYNGKWERPDEVSRQARDDPKRQAVMQEYLERRARAPDTADSQLKLASWCDQNGLKAQAVAHYRRVIHLDPKRDAAWRRLGFKKQGTHWVKPEVVAAARSRAQEQQKADKHWKPILERYRSALQSKSPTRRDDAQKGLAGITEPDAVPMVWATFGRAEPSSQKVAVQVLGQIDDGAASRAGAAGGLRRDGGRAEPGDRHAPPPRWREFAAMLIGMILEPIEYEVKKIQAPGQRGELLIKGQGSAPNVKRLYSPPAAPPITPQPGDRVFLDQNGLPVIDRPMSIGQTPVINQAWLFPQQSYATPAQQQQLVSMLAQSGLGAASQKVGQLLIKAYDNSVFINNKMPILSQNPFTQMAASTALLRPINFGTDFSFTVANVAEIPVGRMQLEAQKSAMAAEQQLENDVASITQYNQGLNQINDRVVPVLKEVSGLDIGPKPLEWQKWYVNLVGYQLNQVQATNNSTVVEDVPLAYQPQPIAIGQFMAPISVQRTVVSAEGRWCGRSPASSRSRASRSATRPDPEHEDRRPGLQADPVRAPQPAQPDLPCQAGRRDDRQQRVPPVLEGRSGLGDGPRPQGGGPAPNARRAERRDLDRDGQGRARV